MIELKGLMWCSDNIPECQNWRKLIKVIKGIYSIENIYENIDNISGKAKGEPTENKHLAFLQKLGEIFTEVPIDIDFQEFEVRS